MTAEEKFNQILSILPDDESTIDVNGAPLCEDNPWTDFTIRTLGKHRSYYGGASTWVLKYTTVAHRLYGTIDIHSICDERRYIADTEVLWRWLKLRGFFGDKFDRNLF